jgi:hypothetical protein
VARFTLKREYTYAVDNHSFIAAVMPQLYRLVEGRFYPLAEERGLRVERDQAVVKTDTGHPVGGISNFTWKARKGMAPGFSLELVHDPRNYFHVTLTAKPFYPLAYLVSVLLGVVLSYFWIPYLVEHWSELFRNWVIIGAVVVMWVVWLTATRTIFLSGILAILSTVAFGFILGFAVGWAIGMVVGRGQHGGRVQPVLESLIAGLDNAPVLGPDAPPPFHGPPPQPYPPPRAVEYGAPGPQPVYAQAREVGPGAPAPSGPATPAPRFPTPRLVGARSFPASSISMAACPQCRGSVAVGVPNCPSCGLALQWS